MQMNCPDCGCDDLVIDYAQGDTICRNCALVVESHMISEQVREDSMICMALTGSKSHLI